MCVQGVLFLVMHCVIFYVCVFGLAENNVSVIDMELLWLIIWCQTMLELLQKYTSIEICLGFSSLQRIPSGYSFE
jgi:hypothetical protein